MDARVRFDWVLGLGDKTRDSPAFVKALRRLVPDLHRRDVYVCGPVGFVTCIVYLAGRLGVPAEAIHHEAYAL